MMTRTTAVGVFENRAEAQKAVQELKRLGFRDDQIGVASREDEAHTKGTTADDKSYASEGAVAGVATGAGIGALWGIGIAAGLLPGIGPVIAGGTLAAVLASAATGAAVAGLAGALVGMGIPEEEAHYYETEFHSGRTVVSVRAENRYDEALAVLRRFGGYDMSTRETAMGTSHASRTTSKTERVTAPASAQTTASGTRKVQVREEELHARKEAVETGEVRVHKEVHTEQRTIQVPVQKEEVVIERRPVTGNRASADDIRAGEEIRIPVREEQVHVEKRPVVKEEVTVGKRKVQDVETVSGTVRKEEVKVEKTGDVDVRGDARK